MSGRRTELDVDVVVEHYEAVTDTFIDVQRAAHSLVSHIHPKTHIFELGVGNGYFAQQLLDMGMAVVGIQPRDRLLSDLRRRRPHIVVVAECRLEDYVFDASHDVIVSHSAVFLCTRHRTSFGSRGETRRSTVFQSFIADAEEMVSNLRRVVDALAAGGGLWVNVQENPLESVVVGAGDSAVTFEMVSCEYSLERRRVEKRFRINSRGQVDEVVDVRSAVLLTDLRAELQRDGVHMSLCDDDQWLLIQKATS